MADIALSPQDPNRDLSATRPNAFGTASVLERIRGFAGQQAVQRSLPTIGLIALLGFAAMLWMTMSGAPQRDLFNGLADADKGAVADALKAANIPYQINRDTGALSVPETSFYQAKMLLAQQGLPKATPDGDTMISSLPLGASRAVEGEKLRSARDLDIARTIEAIDAVENAKIRIAAEQPSVFLRDQVKPTASVMLRLRPGRTLSDMQVQAIVHLVASSVPGLATDGISVVDQSGRLLSAAGGDPVSEASARQVEIQSKIEQRYMASLNKMLTPIVGPGNFTAEVHADMDFTESQATRESYPKDTAVVRAETGSWTANKAGEATGIPGALSNQPPAASQVSAAPNQTVPATPGTTAAAEQGKTSENYNRTFELGREVSVTRSPAGILHRLSVAIALREGSRKFSRAEIASIETLVRGAVGADQARGDVIAISARSFAVTPDEVVTSKWWEASWVSTLARNISALMVVALLIFGVARPLLKRRAAMLDERSATVKAAVSTRNIPANVSPAVRGEIAAALANEALRDSSKMVTLDMIEATPGYTNRAELIRNFVRQDPDRAALVVRDLIRADMPGADDDNG